MCGIFFSSNVSEVSHALDAMRHRGPDGTSGITAGGYHMGFTRLAIVSVDAGEQPRITRAGRFVAFNGELYNYQHLMPRATSEVDMLGELLDRDLDPRQFIDGDYAIVYYNPSQRQVTLYRDRFGVCPLYFQLVPYLAVSSERNLLTNPREVKAHERIVISTEEGRGILQRDRMPHYGATGNSTVRLDTIAALVGEAVRTRAMHTDVGFGLALSGGLDSSVIAYALAFNGLKPDLVVCATPEDEDSADYMAAQAVTESLGWDLVRVRIPDVLPDRRLLLERMDISYAEFSAMSPVKWRGALRNWYVAREAHAHGVKVMLSGEGADELLGGYTSHFAEDRIRDPLDTLAKCLSTVAAMPNINLDRTNKLGMAHSVEYRCPFLASLLSFALLSTRRARGKALFRNLLENVYRAPSIVVQRTKYSEDEKRLEEVR